MMDKLALQAVAAKLIKEAHAGDEDALAFIYHLLIQDMDICIKDGMYATSYGLED